MALIYLSLGSNIDRHRRIDAALDALAEGFGDLSISSVYESESVGFEGDSFYNLVVGINTSLAVGEVSKVLKTIEDQNDRDRSAPKFGHGAPVFVKKDGDTTHYLFRYTDGTWRATDDEKNIATGFRAIKSKAAELPSEAGLTWKYWDGKAWQDDDTAMTCTEVRETRHEHSHALPTHPCPHCIPPTMAPLTP